MRSRGGLAVRLTLAALAAGAAGCSSTGTADPGEFAAQDGDFKNYQTWTSFSLVDPNPGGSTHVAGKRTVYINHEPPAGATKFPVGTVIIKETAADGKIFARAKRSETYDPTGAVGWEWFELQTMRGVTGPVWRGKGPQPGESYGGDPNTGCNTCHKAAVNNDYVLTPELMLTPAIDAGTNTAETNQSADAGAESESEDASHP